MCKTFHHCKKIVIATDAYNPQVNGVVRTLNSTIEILKERGYEVEVICPDDFLSISFPFSMLPGMRLALPKHIGKRLHGANAIHISTEGPIGLCVRNYCEKNKIKYTTAFHTDFAKYLNINLNIPKSWTYKFLKWFHKNSESVMVPTKSMIKELESYGFKNCILWSRGVDNKIFNTSNTKDVLRSIWAVSELPSPYYLNVGRVSKEKNLEDFLKLPLVGTKFVVGNGPEFLKLRDKYPDVYFIGSLEGKELAEIYRSADVFVFPSRFDTFGLVNIESIACGTPVAAYPVTGPKDIIENGVTGYLDEDLENACLNCLKLGKVHKEFDWNVATDQFISNLHFH